MIYSNAHSHTTFSDGANTPEEMANEAIRLGVTSYGFSDHSYTDFDLRYCMKADSFDDYVSTIKSLKEKYKGKIDIMLGMEHDYFSNIDKSCLEYTVGSVHYLKKDGEYLHVDQNKDVQLADFDKFFGGNRLLYAKLFFETATRHAYENKPTFMGHFDLLKKFDWFDESDPVYQKYAKDAVCETIKAVNVFEINSGANARKINKTPYPSDFILKTIFENGGKIILSSDCHRTEHINHGFDASLEILKAIGFKSVLILSSNGFSEQSII